MRSERDVTGIFRDEDRAARATQALADEHFQGDEIGVVEVEGRRAEAVPVRHETAIAPAAAAGTTVGVILGAACGALGLLPAAPPGAVGAILGAVAGAIAGAFLGVLAGLGFWRIAPDFPRPGGEPRSVVVGVRARGRRARAARRALERAGADDVAS